MKSNVYRIIYEDIFHFYDDKFITVHAIKNIKNEKGYNQIIFPLLRKTMKCKQKNLCWYLKCKIIMSEELASLGTPVWLDTAVWTSQIAFSTGF